MADGRLWTGISRGLLRRCPNCGEGKLFRGYLKVEPTCAVCAADNGRFRADDGPAYITILLVGHLVVAPLLAFPFILSWPVWAVVGTTLPALTLLILLLLPRIKGGWVGFLWAQAAARDERRPENAA